MLALFIYLYIRFLLVGPRAQDMCSPSETYMYIYIYIYIYIIYIYILYRLRSHCSIVAFLHDLYGPD